MPSFHVVLVRPEIPQNTGSIARLTAATQTRLHLVGPLGFSLEDRYLKRAGLDYWPLVDLRTYAGWDDFAAAVHPQPAGHLDATGFMNISPRARERSYLEARLRAGRFPGVRQRDQGTGRGISAQRTEATYRIPIFEPGVRSLNLANAVSIVLYEALRQTGRLSA